MRIAKTAPGDDLAGRVARAVRAEMFAQGVTQEAVAAAVGMSQPALSRRLVGAISFAVSEVEAVAAFLDVPIARLIPDAVSV